MAVLQTIREKTILVLVIIGGAMAAFILTDLINSKGPGVSSDNNIGSISGKEISPAEYQKELDFIKNSSQFQNYSEEQQISIAWDKLIQDRLISSISKLVGINVTGKEIYELETGSINDENRDDVFSSFFGIPNQNDVTIIQTFIDDLNNQGQQFRDVDKQQFLLLEKEVIKQRYTQKYQTLIEKGMYITNTEAKKILNFRSQNSMVRYVSIPYTTIDNVDITEEEIIEYYNDNIVDYQNDKETRNVEYVTFTVEPSSQDDLKIKEELFSLFNEFSESNNDEDFSARHSSDVIGYFEYLKADEVAVKDPKFAELITKEAGSVLGPYKLINSNTYRLSKLSEVTSRADKVEFSQIFISQETVQEIGDSTAKAMINDWKRKVEEGEDFGLLASQVSEGEEKSNFGYFGEISESDQLFSNSIESNRRFISKCFESKKGDLKIVRTVDGYHLLQITKLIDVQQKYKIVYTDRNVIPTDTTKDIYFTQATHFNNLVISSDTSFKSIAESENQLYNEIINLDNMKFNVANLENSRKIVKWMFDKNTNEGDISNSIFVCGNKYVVVRLSSINYRGDKPLESVREQIIQKIQQEKKFDIISQRISEGETLANVATIFNSKLDTLEKVNFSNSNIGIGNEENFVGVVDAISIGNTSLPFQGSNSVFLVNVISKSENIITDVEEVQRLDIQKSKSQGIFFYSVMEILKKQSNILDNRIQYY